MIKPLYHTNIDKFKRVKFPEKLVSVPQKGSKIKAVKPVFFTNERTGVSYEIKELILEVVEVTFEDFYNFETDSYEPTVLIELHHRNAYSKGYI